MVAKPRAASMSSSGIPILLRVARAENDVKYRRVGRQLTKRDRHQPIATKTFAGLEASVRTHVRR